MTADKLGFINNPVTRGSDTPGSDISNNKDNVTIEVVKDNDAGSSINNPQNANKNPNLISRQKAGSPLFTLALILIIAIALGTKVKWRR